MNRHTISLMAFLTSLWASPVHAQNVFQYAPGTQRPVIVWGLPLGAPYDEIKGMFDEMGVRPSVSADNLLHYDQLATRDGIQAHNVNLAFGEVGKLGEISITMSAENLRNIDPEYAMVKNRLMEELGRSTVVSETSQAIRWVRPDVDVFLYMNQGDASFTLHCLVPWQD